MLTIWINCVCTSLDYSLIHNTYKFSDMIPVANSVMNVTTWLFLEILSGFKLLISNVNLHKSYEILKFRRNKFSKRGVWNLRTRTDLQKNSQTNFRQTNRTIDQLYLSRSIPSASFISCHEIRKQFPLTSNRHLYIQGSFKLRT